MKATAVAPANIAFIKYWGRTNAALHIPYNPSISVNLSNCTTTTTVEFSSEFERDCLPEGLDKNRIFAHVDRMRKLANTTLRVNITTANSFPTAAGIASSASGFAALTLACATALGLTQSIRELSALARLGSGSAARSIPDGFVRWDGEYAYSLYPPDYWDLRDIVVVVGNAGKEVSSSKGHDAAWTSPLLKKRLEALPDRIHRFERALKTKNFEQFGLIIEEDCLDMHHVMQTQVPPLFYWNDRTTEVIKKVKNSGLPVYFTVDAGPNVHLICQAQIEKKVVEFLGKKYPVIINSPSVGARII